MIYAIIKDKPAIKKGEPDKTLEYLADSKETADLLMYFKNTSYASIELNASTVEESLILLESKCSLQEEYKILTKHDLVYSCGIIYSKSNKSFKTACRLVESIKNTRHVKVNDTIIEHGRILIHADYSTYLTICSEEFLDNLSINAPMFYLELNTDVINATLTEYVKKLLPNCNITNWEDI